MQEQAKEKIVRAHFFLPNEVNSSNWRDLTVPVSGTLIFISCKLGRWNPSMTSSQLAQQYSSVSWLWKPNDQIVIGKDKREY